MPRLRPLCFAIPNGGSRNVVEAVNLKRTGVTPGVADVFCAIPHIVAGAQKHGIWLEFKAPGAKQSSAQVEFERAMLAQGYEYYVIVDWTDAKRLLENIYK